MLTEEKGYIVYSSLGWAVTKILMFDFPLFPRILLHSSNPDCVPLLQNIHHPEEGRQQEEADQERELQEKWNKTGEFPSSFLHTKYSG